MWKENAQTYDRLVWIAEQNATLKKILLDEMAISIRLLVELKKGDHIRVNGKRRIVTDEVRRGDEVTVLLPKEQSEYLPQDIALRIYYEDEDILVVEKPYDMVVHPTRAHLYDTMLNAVLYYFRRNGIDSKVRFVNRLDRYTSGILIIAKNAYAHNALTREEREDEIGKEYIAVLQGSMQGEGTIDAPIAKSEDGIRRIVREDGQRAITHYRVLASNDYASLAEIRLETGRTHQIRVHFSSMGHPLLGDELYGGDRSRIKRQALHARRLTFRSPRRSELVSIKIQLPDDIGELIKNVLPDTGFDEIH